MLGLTEPAVLRKAALGEIPCHRWGGTVRLCLDEVADYGRRQVGGALDSTDPLAAMNEIGAGLADSVRSSPEDWSRWLVFDKQPLRGPETRRDAA